MTSHLMLAALALGAALAGGVPNAGAQSQPAPSPLEPLRFLAGTWRGDANGTPGAGAGSATFAFDLDGRVLVRRARTEYPAAPGRPAAVHDDLMVVYPGPGGRGLSAMYFDNEGHVIEYAVAADGKRVVLTSEVAPSSPTFRLTYVHVDADTVDVTFEIAPPGDPGGFKPYVAGRTRRAPAP